MTVPAIRFPLRPRTRHQVHAPKPPQPPVPTSAAVLRCVTVVLPPEIDISNDAAVLAALTRPLAAGAELVTADMSGTTFCGVAGARAVLRAALAARQAGAYLQVTGMLPQVRRVFLVMTCEP